jgi:hypothetical protein
MTAIVTTMAVRCAPIVSGSRPAHQVTRMREVL